MKSYSKWLLGFSLTYLLNFVGYFFFLYDVLGNATLEENINLVAIKYGGYTGPLFLLELILFIIFFYNEKNGSRKTEKLNQVILVLLPLIALVGHYLILNGAILVAGHHI